MYPVVNTSVPSSEVRKSKAKLSYVDMWIKHVPVYVGSYVIFFHNLFLQQKMVDYRAWAGILTIDGAE